MKKAGFKLRLTVLLLCMVGGQCAWSAQVRGTVPVRIEDTCGRGMLLNAGGQRVLLLAGSPYEMGYQQGKLAGKECRCLIEKILLFTRAAEASGVKNYLKPGSFEDALARSGKFIDRRYFEEMKGLADGAGMEFEDVALANIFPELFHCSGFALFGKAVGNGRLLHGRILDYMTEAGLQEYAAVTVVKPKGYNAFVTVGYTGFVGSVTGMNERQIALGEMGGAGGDAWDGMPMSLLMRKVLEEADTLEQAIRLFESTPRTCEYFYVVSDGKAGDARGLVGRPDSLQVVEPGVSNELLPEAIEDAVLMSAGDRYHHLARLVKEQYGKIDVDAALDLMNRPVAMKSCLHRVLFSPQDGRLWVGNAAPFGGEKYQACYQPYYAHDFNALLGMIPAESDVNRISEPADLKTMEFLKTQAKPINLNEDIMGLVPETVRRKIPAGDSEYQRQLLAAYAEDTAAFSYRMTQEITSTAYTVYEVNFPSPVVSKYDENNTIYCEYFMSQVEGKRPAVVLLDILNGSMIISRILAHSLASQGTDACIMTLPYYGKRKPEALNEQIISNQDMGMFLEAVRQAVADIRRTARWLASRDTIEGDKLGICGTSLGGFVAALSAGVDGRFSRAAFLLAGGDLATVLTTDVKEVRGLKTEIGKRGFDDQRLREILAGIEPLNFSDRLGATKILMINGSKDPIVPAKCAIALAESTGTTIHWYPTDHYGMISYLVDVVSKTESHFSPSNW